jgi:predicted N-formylglutamate amidohydrolase
LLLTVEHASRAIPAEFGGLGLGPKALESHIAWDPGAVELGRALHEELGGRLLEGKWSRLLVDLNRSETNPRVAPARTFGVDVPGNVGLSREQRRERIEKYWRPFRSEARRAAEGSELCLHVGVHTFTPVMAGEVRDYDLAVLFDPGRKKERELAGEIVQSWRAAGWKARRNAPYRGVTDGHTTALRREFPAGRYAGLEIEVNQRSLGNWPIVTEAVVAGVGQALAKQKTRR